MTSATKKVEVEYVFFGTGEIARGVLEELVAAGLRPVLVVTGPDRAHGRGLLLKPSPVAELAAQRGIEILKPTTFGPSLISNLKARNAPLFVLADYGTLLPNVLLDIPAKGVLNMHPSLLPRLRGPSPIRSAILKDERETGVSIILLDEKMDHGPLVGQKAISIPQWPPRGRQLDVLLAREGGKLLATVLPLWAKGAVEARPQNHDLATYCRPFTKADGLIDLADAASLTGRQAYRNLLKIRAFEGWPGAYAFFERSGHSRGQKSQRIRVQILDAHIGSNAGADLIIDTVKPEGKGEMPYRAFLNSGARPA